MTYQTGSFDPLPSPSSEYLSDTALIKARDFGRRVADSDFEFERVPARERYQPSPQERAYASAARQALNKTWRRIAREIAVGNERAARRTARTLMGSEKLRFWAAYHALRRSRPAQRKNLTVAELATLARDLDTSGGVAYAKRQAKTDGGYRVTHAYSLVDRTRQIILAKSLGMLVRFHPRQTGVPGRGAHHAVREVRRLIQSGNYAFARQFDVRDCFGSVDAGWIAREFGIPSKVQREVLTNQGKEDRGEIRPLDGMGNICTYSQWTRPQSLPQGASSSPVFAYGLIRPIIEDFERTHPEVAIISNCDNFLLMAPTRRALEAASMSLISMCAEHPAGSLLVRPVSPLRRLSDGIEYLGYRFVKKKAQPIVQATAAKIKTFRRTLAALVREIDKPRIIGPSRSDRVSCAALYVLHHLPTFKPAVDDFSDLLSHSVDRLRHHVTNPEVQALIRFDERHIPVEEDSIENSLGAGTNRWKRNILRWGLLHDVDHEHLHNTRRLVEKREAWLRQLGGIVPQSRTAFFPMMPTRMRQRPSFGR